VSEPVNLKRFRKRRERAADARVAEAKRAREGLSRAERTAAAKAEQLRARRLAGAKRDSCDGSGEQKDGQRHSQELSRDPRPKRE